MGVHVEPAAIEIAAPPETVRDLVLDFPNMSSWHHGHFKSISVQSGKQGKDLVEGDKLSVVLESGMSFSPAVLENSPTRFKWRGSLPGIFTGDHVFEFQASRVEVGSTTFVQYEDFSGLLSFTMKLEKKSGRQNMNGFIAFNRDVKMEAEKRTKMSKSS